MTRRCRPSFLSSSGAIRSRELLGRQGKGLRSVRKIITSCVPPQLIATYFWSRLTATPCASLDGLSLRIQRKRAETTTEPSSGTRVSRWPSTQPRSILFLVVGKPAIAHVGDVTRLAVRADGDLAKVVAVDRNGLQDRPCAGVDDGDALRPRVADEESRLVGRQGDPARLSADGQPAGDLSAFRSTRTTSLLTPTATKAVEPSAVIATPRGSGPTSMRPATAILSSFSSSMARS